jgi:5'(3')-deoxyribonucleotidase
MIICFDIDNTINDLAEKAIALYNARANKNIQIADITTYNFYDCLSKEDADGITALFKDKELWDSLKPLPYSQEVLKKLSKQGHRIFLATATDPINFEWKCDWFSKYFNFIPTDNIIRIMDKSLLKIDVMVDDHLSNLTNNICERVCLNYPWNQSKSKDYAYDIKRAKNWNDIINIINNIEKEMRKWEKNT